jgi:alkylation response protein AidB-like acyl-CoA dehydrogenase
VEPHAARIDREAEFPRDVYRRIAGEGWIGLTRPEGAGATFLEWTLWIEELAAASATVADMATDMEAARLLIHRAARLRDAGCPHTREAAMAKMRASDVAMETMTNALQAHAGAGYRKDLPLERYVRDVKLTQIYEGTNQIQRIVIAREILG